MTMTANSYGLIIEGLVATLLVLTISYCMVLNRRLSKLRNDETSFKGTIAELIASTESAERAIAGLKLTVRESEEILAARLRSSELIAADLQRELKRGEGVISRIARIAEAADSARPREDADIAPVVEVLKAPVVHTEALIRRKAAETIAAAQALANRAKRRADQAA
jgi:uncharacterized protein DUF6468